ncbi:hypothetical protein LY78DRAFT_379467 [Colletotrichum sublineola]|nr:hypothetical protein LY78DRAFT_379467 [Colletotrichum sublineola]
MASPQFLLVPVGAPRPIDSSPVGRLRGRRERVWVGARERTWGPGPDIHLCAFCSRCSLPPFLFSCYATRLTPAIEQGVDGRTKSEGGIATLSC